MATPHFVNIFFRHADAFELVCAELETALRNAVDVELLTMNLDERSFTVSASGESDTKAGQAVWFIVHSVTSRHLVTRSLEMTCGGWEFTGA